MSITVQRGRLVHLEYTVAFATGEVIESSAGQPVTFRIGDGTLPEALETVLVGRPSGDHGELELAPDEAFGRPDEARILRLDPGTFGPDRTVESRPVAPGQLLEFDLPSGERVAGRVLAIEDAGIDVDFNHPLAGHRLRFQFHIRDVQA